MKFIKQWFHDRKLHQKLMIIYFFIGTIPMLFLGMLIYSQQRKNLLEKAKRSMQDAVSQSVEQFSSQLKTYENMSDYLAFNVPISNVLSGEYTSVYALYEQYTKNVDPVLSSLRYFNPNIKRTVIYVDRKIAEHGNFVAPLSDVKKEQWYLSIKDKKKQAWNFSRKEKKAVNIREMPLLKQNGLEGYLYMAVNYDSIFKGFSDMMKWEYGVYVLSEKGKVLYEYNNYKKERKDNVISAKQVIGNYNSQKLGKRTGYTIVTKKENGCHIYFYRPNHMIVNPSFTLIGLLLGIFIICLGTSFAAAKAFSVFVVQNVEKLQKNMLAIEEGNMEITVTSDSKDEIGDLIRGFGRMLEKIDYLIHEVYESKLKQKKYEMTALQAQINPHFLYNSLSLINWKALEAGANDISEITLSLSAFYRTSLNKGNNTLPLERELENMKSYLQIQSCMHDDSFDVLVDVDPAILSCITLNLLLQPLVENAIEHGVDLIEEDDVKGVIKITGKQKEDLIVLTVEDNGVGIEPDVLASILEFKTRGYGVRNVNQRIKLFYGDEYGLSIESEVGKGTKSIITIPMKEK